MALNNGFKQVEVSRLLSVPERTIRRWVAQMRAEGVDQLEPKRRGRRAGEASALGARQMKRIETMVIGKMPDQMRLPFYLWTREAVGALIEREYGLKLSPASVGNYLKRWGMSPQKPVRRAYERSDEAIARWLDTDYPLIAANAKNVAEFKAGNEKALNALVGQIMKASKGKANPQQVNDLLRQKIG